MRQFPALALALRLFTLTTLAEDWPQFRGPGGRAVSETATPPIGFGLTSNLVWKVAVPSGKSSPVVTGRRIFLTAVDDGRLELFCLDRKDGHVIWRKPAPTRKFEPSLGMDSPGPATPTPVTDGKSVFVLHGAYGLIAYDLEGNEQWREPLAVPEVEVTASPILIGDKLISICDRELGSFIEARDKKTGRTLWRTERAQSRRSGATPFHWVHGQDAELIVPGSLWLTSYDPVTGGENWRYTGTARVAASSPAASESLLFSASSKSDLDGNWRYLGDAGGATNSRATGGSQLPAASGNDAWPANLNGGSEADSPLSLPSFGEPGQISKEEPSKAGQGLVAIRPGGHGDVTQTHLAWRSERGLPYGSSPLFYKGRLFTIKSGGLVSAYDATDGRSIYQAERLNAPGDYYASAVAAAGRIYFSSFDGIVTVISATNDTPVILAQNKLDEQILATPALVDQYIVVRTATNLYSFGITR
jgi:outer membrane protein assembly factor BamB